MWPRPVNVIFVIDALTPWPIEGRHQRPVEKDEIRHGQPVADYSGLSSYRLTSHQSG